MSSFLARPPVQPDTLRVTYPEVVIEIRPGLIVRAKPTRVDDEMYLAWKLSTPEGEIENVTKMSMKLYTRGLEIALNKLGPARYRQYLGQLPEAPPGATSRVGMLGAKR
jgi:hypothetical protein